MSQKLFVFILLLYSPTITWANERIALVIGNASYKNVKILPNAINDAQGIAEALETLEFDVTLKKDLNRKEMLKEINAFGKKLGKDTVGLFYYAGHALQMSGNNYLLPLDASIDTPDEVHFDGVDVNRILTKMGLPRNGLNIMILDACRNNPFEKYTGFKSSTGLATMKAPENFLIVYATTPGKKALDGPRKNGLFTEYLLKNIALPKRDITAMLTTVRNSVIKESVKLGHKQVPWETSSLLRPFCFKSCLGPKRPDEPEEPDSKIVNQPKPPTPPRKPKALVRQLHSIPDIEMVLIEGGIFNMGCKGKDCDEDEKPVRSVTIASFYMGKYEVTFDQWDACVKAKVCSYVDDNGWGRGQRPVINVSWHDTQKFITWLNTWTGKTYRLPTESEWEYTARAETKTNYPWGDAIGSNYANCESCGSKWDNKSTAPVGSFSAYYDLYDMHGNVWEWVQDCHHQSYAKAPTDHSAWKTGCSKNKNGQALAVLRGGSWSSSPKKLRSTHRFFDSYDRRPSTYGFRVAR